MTDDTREWTCVCGARGTLTFPANGAEAERDPSFHCPRCRRVLKDCRRPRRPAAGEKGKSATSAADDPDRDLSDEDIERSAKEWERTQEHLGRLGAMAESMWALDWADRLLAEVRRLRGRS